MYVMYPIAYPIALLLDKILGEDHGTMYKRAGLKTLVTLHKSMGVERLNEDEVTIISAVLDLKEKPVGDIMTPMEDVFVLSADTILDEPTMEMILHTGFNRIPIHVPDDPQNFIGMLLVRILITYDPEDALPISSFPLATLPETAPGTTCLNILNFFQEGKSHMVVVSENPGEPSGALGVVTLEDVIEELIGEEIIDESDVYVDVHKAIRRAQPGPFAKGQFSNPFSKRNSTGSITAPIAPQLERALMSALGDSQRISGSQAARQLKLGPSNKATAPLVTHIPNITVKNLSHNVQPNGTLRTADVPDGVANDDPQKTPVLVRTEEGAIQEALMADADRRETALANPGDLGYGDASASLLDLPETRTYRTGGIVESVVNVSGISKIVIGDEESANRRSRRGSSTSGKSSRANSNSSRDDLRPLLSRTFD
jgi:metal transporter CNNM